MLSCQKVIVHVTLPWSELTPIVRLHFSHFCTFSQAACLFITISASLESKHSRQSSNTISIVLYKTNGKIDPHIREQAVF